MAHMILINGDYAQGKFIPEGATVINKARPSLYHSWDGADWVFDGWPDDLAAQRMRHERNSLLVETDWQATSDRKMSNEQQIYRQQLRDLPSTSSPELDEDGQLTGVTWPTKPADE